MEKYNSIPIPGHKPFVPLVNGDTMAFTTEHEGAVSYLYKDGVNQITTGIGFNVNGRPKEAHKLRFFWANGRETTARPASLQDVKEAFRRIKLKKPGLAAKEYDPAIDTTLLNIRMRREDMDAPVRRKLQQAERELKIKIPNFDTIPYSARKVFLDMQYNMGDKKFRASYRDPETGKDKGWPNLYAAIDARDWRRAAKESRRGDVSDTRNKVMSDLLMEADRLEQRR